MNNINEKKGNLLITDRGFIKKILKDGTVIHLNSLSGGEEGHLDGSISQSKFSGACGIDVDSKGNIYVAGKTQEIFKTIYI